MVINDANPTSTSNGGNFLAIMLCYVLCVISGFTVERSVRQSFAAAKSVVYQNAEVTSAIHLCDKLLNNVLPVSIVRRMKASPEHAIVDEVPEASVMFLYNEGMHPDFNQSGKDTEGVINEMNQFVWLMDSLCAAHGVEKIKTTPFLIVSGCPEPVPQHTRRLILLARDVLANAALYNKEHGTNIRIKAGIHTGKVTAGVLGATKFIYDVFGDTVNFASRLTSSAEWETVQLSAAAQKLVGKDFDSDDMGIIELKGKGPQQIFRLQLDCAGLRAVAVAEPDYSLQPTIATPRQAAEPKALEVAPSSVRPASNASNDMEMAEVSASGNDKDAVAQAGEAEAKPAEDASRNSSANAENPNALDVSAAKDTDSL
jgi:hypothetical protein